MDIRGLLFAALAGLPYGIGHAQMMLAGLDEDMALLYGDDEIISIATGTEKPIHLAPSVASVITADDIKAMGAATVAEALEFVPGLHISKSYNRMSDLLSIRGIHSQFNAQVLFLVNGVVVEDLQINSLPTLFTLPVANVSRIEVMRGPGSAVYGADAFAGVVNVITKSADEIGAGSVGVRAGSFDTTDVWAQTSGALGEWDAAFSFEYRSAGTDKDRIIESDAQGFAFDPMLGTSASLAPGPINTDMDLFNTSITLNKDAWNIWFNSWNLRDAGVGAGVAPALDPIGGQDADLYNLQLTYSENDYFKHTDLDARVSYSRYWLNVYFQLFPPGAMFPIGADGNLLTPSDPSCPVLAPGGAPTCLVSFSDGVVGNPWGASQTYTSELAMTYHRFADHQIRLAIGMDHFSTEQGEKKNFGPGVIDGTDASIHGSSLDDTLTNVTDTDGIYLPDKSRTLAYLTLQDEWKFAPDWELTAGVRYDDYSDFGSTVNPRAALVWAADYNLTTKLLYGRAFRSPSFGELYYINNPSTTGNPDLDPETIDMAELVFDYRPNFDLQTVFNVYAYKVDGLIDFVGGKAQNAHDLEGHGLEADINWQLGERTTLLTNFAWQHSINSDTNQDIADAPGHQASIALRHRGTKSCAFSGQANWVAHRKRAKEAFSTVAGVSNDSRDAVDDYTTVDFTVYCQLQSAPIELAVSLRNAFDADAHEPSPYNPDLQSANMPGDFPLQGRNGYVELVYRFE